MSHPLYTKSLKMIWKKGYQRILKLFTVNFASSAYPSVLPLNKLRLQNWKTPYSWCQIRWCWQCFPQLRLNETDWTRLYRLALTWSMTYQMILVSNCQSNVEDHFYGTSNNFAWKVDSTQRWLPAPYDCLLDRLTPPQPREMDTMLHHTQLTTQSNSWAL